MTELILSFAQIFVVSPCRTRMAKLRISPNFSGSTWVPHEYHLIGAAFFIAVKTGAGARSSSWGWISVILRKIQRGTVNMANILHQREEPPAAMVSYIKHSRQTDSKSRILLSNMLWHMYDHVWYMDWIGLIWDIVGLSFRASYIFWTHVREMM